MGGVKKSWEELRGVGGVKRNEEVRKINFEF